MGSKAWEDPGRNAYYWRSQRAFLTLICMLMFGRRTRFAPERILQSRALVVLLYFSSKHKTQKAHFWLRETCPADELSGKPSSDASAISRSVATGDPGGLKAGVGN